MFSSSSAPLRAPQPTAYILGPLEGGASEPQAFRLQMRMQRPQWRRTPLQGHTASRWPRQDLNPGLLLRRLLLLLVPPSQPSPERQQEGPTPMCLDPVRLDSFSSPLSRMSYVLRSGSWPVCNLPYDALSYFWGSACVALKTLAGAVSGLNYIYKRPLMPCGLGFLNGDFPPPPLFLSPF